MQICSLSLKRVLGPPSLATISMIQLKFSQDG